MPPNTQLSQAANDALPYWSAIRGAAVNHLTTAQLWAAIREVQEQYGTIGHGPTVQGISVLRGIAGAIVQTGDELAKLPDSKGLRALTVARAPWARSLGQQRANPRYQVQFQHTFQIGEEQTTQWRTIMFDGRLPQTVGELRSQIEEDVQNLSDDYNVAHIDATSFQLMSV